MVRAGFRDLIEVVYRDADLIAVVKPAGMATHPSPGHESGTLTDEVKKLFPEIAAVGSAERPGVVHRLDAETSGIMVLARTQAAYLKLREFFERHDRVEKTYLAVTHGAPKPQKGVIDEPIDGKRAITRWQVLGRSGDTALVEFKIETGRTHQIRIHAKRLGHPIVGDRLYGDAATKRRAKRLLLHAVSLALPHPITGKRMEFTAEVPADIVYLV